MPQSVRRIRNIYLSAYMMVFGLAILLPGFFLVFEDSEIWGITSSRRLIDDPSVFTSAYFKPLFSLIFGAIVSTAPSSWGALLISRGVTFGFAAIGLFAIYSLAIQLLNVGRRASSTLIFFAVLSTMPMLILHFSKARSDVISVSIAAVGAVLLMQFQSDRPIARGLIYIFSALSTLLVTLKSIDLVAVLMIFFWSTSGSLPLRHRIMWIVGPLTALVSIGLIFSRQFILNSLLYWFDSYEAIHFFSVIPWISCIRAVQSAPIVSLFVASGLVTGALQYRKLTRDEKLLVAAGFIVGLFIVIHSQKYFFFLASRMPLLALGALPGFHILAELIARKVSPQTLLYGLIAALGISGAITVLRLQYYEGFNRTYQQAAYEMTESYLDRARPNSYWDAIGLFPTRNQIFHYPSPGDRINGELLNFVAISQPSLILRTSKMELLEPQLLLWLQRNYISLSSQIYGRFQVIPKTRSCLIDPEQIVKLVESAKFEFPLALFVRTRTVPQWIRAGFRSQHGLEHAELDLKTLRRGKIELPSCRQDDVEYAIMEAAPWDALPAPNFTPFFGYDGML
ncbi:hypothetical protein BH10BDE1_BH10BDE1_32480 [soil metagenome]